MRIAVLSDIHDHVWNLGDVLQHVQDADSLVCCGDLCSPFVVSQLASGFSGRIEIVLGNNDGDALRIGAVAARHEHLRVHPELFVGELYGKRFIVSHYPSVASVIGGSSADVIAFGHDHRFFIDRRESALVINPGTVMGYSPLEQRDVPATFVIYDAATDEASGYALENGGVREYHGQR